jgi:hypothetical protein
MISSKISFLINLKLLKYYTKLTLWFTTILLLSSRLNKFKNIMYNESENIFLITLSIS